MSVPPVHTAAVHCGENGARDCAAAQSHEAGTLASRPDQTIIRRPETGVVVWKPVREAQLY
jgi:hypothetical protein